ncbi:MAG: hypothetical protein ABL901_15700 [Hyphomicrobiaceae bacterium]
MKFDLSKPVLNRAGQPIKLSADGPDATLAAAIVHVLDGYVDQPQHPGQVGQAGNDAQRRFVLGTKISAAPGGIADLTQDDVTFVKKFVGASLLLPLVTGLIFEAFEHPLADKPAA